MRLLTRFIELPGERQSWFEIEGSSAIARHGCSRRAGTLMVFFSRNRRKNPHSREQWGSGIRTPGERPGAAFLAHQPAPLSLPRRFYHGACGRARRMLLIALAAA